MRLTYLSLLISCIVGAAVLDRVAVIVGTDVITEGEVIDELRLDEFMAFQPPDLSPEKRFAAAQRLVDQQLIRHEMEVARFQPPDPSEADPMLRNFRQPHFKSDAEFRAALQKYGITEDQMKQHLLWQLTVIRFTDVRFRGILPGSSEQSASRSASPPSAPRDSAPVQSADRLVTGASNPQDVTDVDQQLDAWLKQARASTRIEFKKEAFR